MRIKLIEDLPMATSAELEGVRNSVFEAEKVTRSGGHWGDGKLRSARVVSIHGDHVALLDVAANKAIKVHYAAILTEPSAVSPESGPTPAVVEPNRLSPPPEVPGRTDFRVGHRVTFIDKNLQPRVGMIVRVNQHTATLDCDGQKWRVAFELLRPLVSV